MLDEEGTMGAADADVLAVGARYGDAGRTTREEVDAFRIPSPAAATAVPRAAVVALLGGSAAAFLIRVFLLTFGRGVPVLRSATRAMAEKDEGTAAFTRRASVRPDEESETTGSEKVLLVSVDDTGTEGDDTATEGDFACVHGAGCSVTDFFLRVAAAVLF